MLADGVYELFYRPEYDQDDGFDSMTLAVRDGNILGSDRWGGLLTGRCEHTDRSEDHKIEVRFHVPPGGMLVTDEQPRMAGGSVEWNIRLKRSHDTASGLVELGGQQVRVELLFIGPVPF